MFCNLSTRSVNEGGLIILVSKSSCPREESITHKKLIPGRVSRVLIQGVGCRQIVYNIHNQDFLGDNMSTVCSAIQSDLNDCSLDTLNTNLIACGDMNIPSDLGRFFDYSRPVPVMKSDAGKDRHMACYSNGGRLGKVLKDHRRVEVEPSAPTRYNSTNNTGTTIDRILVNAAPCLLRQSEWSSITI